MATLHLVEGPVGAGKTTFARQLGHTLKTPPLILDDWMVRLFSPDRPQVDIWPWYVSRKTRCIDQIWALAIDLLNCDHPAILELGLLRADDRRQFCNRVAQAGFDLRVYVLDLPSDLRWQRVQQRNSQRGDTYSMQVSQEVFAMASQMWEPPGPDESAAFTIEFVASRPPRP